MKKVLISLALSTALSFVPVKAETKKDGTHHAKHSTSKTTKHPKSTHKDTTKPKHKKTAAEKEKKHAKAGEHKTKAHDASKPKTSTTKEKSVKSSESSGWFGNTAASKPAEKDEVVGKTADGKPVFEGAHTGHYYKNASGHKEYVQNFDGAKIVGKTHDGRNIYEGPRGGHFYYTEAGNKEYVKR